LINPTLKTRARPSGSALVAALERLLSFPQNRVSTDSKPYATIRAYSKMIR
jgi:hypothetical protein